MGKKTSKGKRRELSAEEIQNLKPGPVRHGQLSPDLTERARSLYARVGHLMYPTFEQWELGFCRDTHPEREIAVWEVIASTFDAYLAEHPDVDQKRIVGELGAISAGGKFKHENRETRRLRELFEAAWEQRE